MRRLIFIFAIADGPRSVDLRSRAVQHDLHLHPVAVQGNLRRGSSWLALETYCTALPRTAGQSHVARPR
jgi:hypothetical protein